MSFKLLKTEEEFLDSCPCAYKILNFVDAIKDTDVRWFFDSCYFTRLDKRYTAIFKSYALDEYRDYVLSIEANKSGEGGYDLRIIKKVDNLLSDNE